jgi:hypothetical protein
MAASQGGLSSMKLVSYVTVPHINYFYILHKLAQSGSLLDTHKIIKIPRVY